MFNLPWIEKYRPKNMDEIIDHRLKIQTLRNLMHRNELTHLLFYGAPGLGKTSLALSLARELYGDDYRMYILELNASDERGIDVVRNKIPQFIQSRSDRIKMVILDEADAMTSEAQNAIRRVMENAIRTSRFVLICNNIKKIIPELQSRCVKMRFAPLDGVRVNERLHHIIEEEGVKISPEALEALIHHVKDFRQLLNSLQCLHFNNTVCTDSEPIGPQNVYEFLGIPDDSTVDRIYQDLLSRTYQDNLTSLRDLLFRNEWNLAELITRISVKITQSTPPLMNDDFRYYLINKLSQIECRLVIGRDSEIQLMSLVSAFIKGKKKCVS